MLFCSAKIAPFMADARDSPSSFDMEAPMRLALIIIPFLVAACGTEAAAPLPPVDERSLQVEVVALTQVAHPNDPVMARISNRSSEVVYENLCDGGLEGFGFIPGKWNGSYGFGRACIYDLREERTPSLRPIQPGASVLDTFYVNAQSYAGSWRFNFDLQDRDSDLLPLERRVSQSFAVVR
jgi:hypothetical protein